MMRRLFTASAGVSLIGCILSVAVAAWAIRRHDGWAVARHGMFVSVERQGGGGEGRGDLVVVTMPWPRNEPLVAVNSGLIRFEIMSGVWTRDVWFASQLGGRGCLPWGVSDPWNRPTMTTARPMQVPLTFTFLGLWKLGALFGVLPLVWIVRRIFRPKRRFSGFEVERIGLPQPIHPQSAQR